MLKYLVPIFFSAVITGTAAIPATVDPAPVPQTVTCPRLEVAAVLRNRGNGWYAIDDSGHAPINVKSVTNNSKFIEIEYTFVADKTNTLIVTTDENFAIKGYFTGASVAVDRAKIYIAKDGVRLNPNEVVSNYGNLWVYGVFTGSC